MDDTTTPASIDNAIALHRNLWLHAIWRGDLPVVAAEQAELSRLHREREQTADA